MEEWKEYPHNPKYLISSYGRVKSLYKSQRLGGDGGILAGKINKNGYRQVGLQHLDKLYSVRYWHIHRLVALLFLPNPERLPEVSQKDGDKLNSYVKNLRWVTHLDNIQEGIKSGKLKTVKGEDHWMYGTKASKNTRGKMSKSKKGKGNPRYKGYYLIDGEKYYSSTEAGNAIGINQKTVLNRVASDKFLSYVFVKDPKKAA